MATATHKSALFIMLILSFFLLSSAFSESEILIQFKGSIEDPKNLLSDWSNTSSTHYCDWTGVSCTNITPPAVSSVELQNMNLSGEISAPICQLASLSSLNLACNFFNQPIPLHLSECGHLVSLNLSNNLIWGTLPEQISLFKSLQVLDLRNNHIEGQVPEGIGLLQKLKVVNLGNNLLSGSLPVVFGNFTDLVVLDLSRNPLLNSEIPVDIGGLSKLEQLLLQSSSFYGGVPAGFFTGLKRLTVLDLSQNNLTGKIPQIIEMPYLVTLDVSQNKFYGEFPVSICESDSLVSLSLHSNFFNGSIPNEHIKKCAHVEKFEVQNNGFTGDFPSLLWSLPNLKLIRAENNRFTGSLPDSVSEHSQLEQVQLDNNSLTGRYPVAIGKITSLYRFSASQNSLDGELSPNFCDSPVMSIMNLSHNFLSGKIPEVRNCKMLVLLSLADNAFVEEIPESLSELPVLTYLDLSHNNLTGSIPRELGNLKLALFNVSFNKLTGRVPSSLISGLPASFLQGNSGLCGPGLPDSCSDEMSMRHKSGFAAKLTCALVFTALALPVFVFAFVFYSIRMYKRKCQMRTGKSVFFYPLRVTEHDLITAMDEKSARGEGGSFGRTYLVNLRSSELIVVKRILLFTSQSSKSLMNEVENLAKIRHKNIAKILGFCHSDHDSILLIYEYMPNGSLGDVIGKPDFNFPWSVRLKIAIGIAQGLAYFHHDYHPHLLHRNLKSNNVLLDADFEPKLADFALDRIIGENAFRSTVATTESSSWSYSAPEYGHSKKAMEQTDTYSFGVILLELLTGKQAEANGSEDSCVVKFVRRKINLADGVMKILDPKMISSNWSSPRQEMVEALEIGMHCTSVIPEKRPSMRMVFKALEGLQSKTSVVDGGSVTV